MQLPTCEKDDEQMVGIPKPFKVGAASLFDSKPNHDGQSGGHDPASDTGTSREISCEKRDNTLTSVFSISIGHSETVEVDHVREDVHSSASDNGPGGSFMESDVLIKRNDIIERRPTKEGNEVSANREKDENDIDVKNKSSGTSNGISDAKNLASRSQVVFQLIVEKPKDGYQQMKEYPDEKEQTPSAFIDHPKVEFLLPTGGLKRAFDSAGDTRGPLQALQSPPFGFVTHQMGWLYGAITEIGMLV
jgi:hypothetical protein